MLAKLIVLLLICQSLSQYTKREKAKVILLWHKSKSVTAVQRDFRRELRGGNYKANAPDIKTIQKWYSNFNNFGEFDTPAGGYRGATVVNEVHIYKQYVIFLNKFRI